MCNFNYLDQAPFTKNENTPLKGHFSSFYIESQIQITRKYSSWGVFIEDIVNGTLI